MSTHLETGEPAGRGLRRVCRSHVAKALICLKKSEWPDTVHNVRREIKKLRAIFRLAKNGMRPKDFRKISKTMRLSSKPLSAVRDAQITRQALKDVAGRRARKFSRIGSALDDHFIRTERSFSDNDFGAITKLVLTRTSRLVEDLDLKDIHWPEVRIRLLKSYKRGRKAYQRAIKQPSPENFHAWRKAVKNFGYQLIFLCPEWPGQSKQLVDSLDKLGELLGNSHDLILLQQFANDRFRESSETKLLKQLVKAKLKEYDTKIRHLGVKIFSRDPKIGSSALESDWKTWRKNG